jgi:hypothetical protein
VNKCTWIGKGEGCGKSRQMRSYCADHVWRVYQQGTHLNRRKKDIKTANQVHIWESLFNEVVEELEAEGDV